MKSLSILLVVILLVGGAFLVALNYSQTEEPIDTTIVVEPIETTAEVPAGVPLAVTPISHATMVLRLADVVIYTDPVGEAEAFVGQPAADVVLVTDIHGDHLSTSTLMAVVGASTTLIVPQAVQDLLPDSLKAISTVMANDGTVTDRGLTITAIPMYNLPETDDSRHPKGRGNGYVVEGSGNRVYIAGDTGAIPEMKALTNIDAAFIPMNLPYTMSIEDAAQAVVAFAPKKVYPYHYRGPDGLADVEKFKTLVTTANPNILVELLGWY